MGNSHGGCTPHRALYLQWCLKITERHMNLLGNLSHAWTLLPSACVIFVMACWFIERWLVAKACFVLPLFVFIEKKIVLKTLSFW